jgi:hypothetical protein
MLTPAGCAGKVGVRGEFSTRNHIVTEEEWTMRYGILLVIFVVILTSGFAVAAPAESEPNNDPSSADPITLGGSDGGSLSVISDNDWFFFNGEAGMQVRIELYHNGSFLGISDMAIDLWGPGPTWLTFSDTAPSGTVDYERIDYTLTTTGIHYILVSAYSWSSIAHAYSLQTTWLNQPTPTPTATETPTPTFTPWVPVTGVDAGTWEIYR